MNRTLAIAASIGLGLATLGTAGAYAGGSALRAMRDSAASLASTAGRDMMLVRNELEHVAGFLARVPVTYTIIRPSALVEYYWAGVKIKPTSFLIDKNGRVLRRYVGASPEQIAGLAADVEAVLDGRTMANQVMPPAPALPEAYKERLGGGSGR